MHTLNRISANPFTWTWPEPVNAPTFMDIPFPTAMASTFLLLNNNRETELGVDWNRKVISPLNCCNYQEYRPNYWLFEGQQEKACSTYNIQNIFAETLQAAKLSSKATTSTLQHRFTFHLLQ